MRPHHTEAIGRNDVDRQETAGLGFTPLLVFAALSYPLALGWLQLFLPRIERAEGA